MSRRETELQRAARERFTEAFQNAERYSSSRAWLDRALGGWGVDLDLSDVAALQDPNTDEGQRAALAKQICPKLASFWVVRGGEVLALKEAIALGEDAESVKRWAVETGFVLASARSHEPQTVRFGQQWLKDYSVLVNFLDGDKQKERPIDQNLEVRPATDLSWPLYLDWLRQSTLTEAGRWLVSEYGAPDEAPTDTDAPTRFSVKQGKKVALDNVVDSGQGVRSEPDATEASEETQELFEICRLAGSPQGRKCFAAWLDHGGDREDLDAAAESLGITKNQFGVQIRRIKQKVREENPDLFSAEG